jgi:methylmalonyl-CoA mutase
MQNESTPLAAPEGREAWLKAALKSLKGTTVESLAVHTIDGLDIEPLYDSAPERSAVREATGWDIRAPIQAADPAEANRLAHEALGGGATSILLDIGGFGSAPDLRQALDGVVIEAAPLALDAGLQGPLAAEWLAQSGGAGPAAALGLNMDPLGAFAITGESPGPIEGHVHKAAETAAKLAETYPAASLFVASGRAAHEAGGSPAQELGMAAAAAVAYARAMADAGPAPDQALGRIALGLSADAEVLVSIAKLRAARRIWARIAGACGSDAPARIEARSSHRMLTASDPWTNLLRLTLAGFAGAVGGADVLVLGAFTDALGRPAERARRLARNTQLILMEEAGLGRLADPAAGAWALESLTDQLARQGWSFFQAIEQKGGLAAALTSGFIAEEVAKVHAAREDEIAEGRRPILGVTDFPDPEPLPVEVEPAAVPRAHPDIRVPGPDSRCPPLAPVRISAVAETIAGDLEP